jgi:ubiquinone/menaquinone biosynthesis C-methylase UbiE
MLKAVKSQAQEKGLINIKTILADIEVLGGIKIEDSYLDLVLLSNVFFQSKAREGIVKEVKRILKPKGKFVVIEWKMDAPFGPDKADRLSKEDALKMIHDVGFELKKEINTGSFHYGLMFEKV